MCACVHWGWVGWGSGDAFVHPSTSPHATLLRNTGLACYVIQPSPLPPPAALLLREKQARRSPKAPQLLRYIILVPTSTQTSPKSLPMSDADAAEEHGQRAAPARISFIDHFAGTTVTVSSPHIPWLPYEQAALVQVTRPLRLMKAAAWFIGRRWPAAGYQHLLQQPLPPLDCVRDGCAASVPARAMFGWVASAPGHVLVSDKTVQRWVEWMMECVSRGRVRRLQAQPVLPPPTAPQGLHLRQRSHSRRLIVDSQGRVNARISYHDWDVLLRKRA